jgi:hypothetical protein
MIETATSCVCVHSSHVFRSAADVAVAETAKGRPRLVIVLRVAGSRRLWRLVTVGTSECRSVRISWTAIARALATSPGSFPKLIAAGKFPAAMQASSERARASLRKFTKSFTGNSSKRREEFHGLMDLSRSAADRLHGSHARAGLPSPQGLRRPSDAPNSARTSQLIRYLAISFSKREATLTESSSPFVADGEYLSEPRGGSPRGVPFSGSITKKMQRWVHWRVPRVTDRHPRMARSTTRRMLSPPRGG